MIDFQKITPALYPQLRPLLCKEGHCEYSFVNLCIWGKQRTAFVHGHYAFFSQFNRHLVYLFPTGDDEVKPVVEAILEDAQQRGIRCYLTGLSRNKCDLLENLFPGKFRFHTDRDDYDYLYNIDDLADLKGRKYQKKRNHLHKFRACCPHACVEPLSAKNAEQVCRMAESWYESHQQANPWSDIHLEQAAFTRAMNHFDELPLEGLVLKNCGEVIAFTMASPLSEDTYDIHFEKALDTVDGAYTAINQAFAAWLRDKHPNLRYLNREDDVGLEGLRKAKLSYYPVRLVEKFWATPKEENDE